MSEINNAKSNIADKIHAAVSSLLETEMRLNADLMEARDIAREQKAEIHRLQEQLAAEQHARQELEQIVSRVAELTGSKATK